MELPESVKVWSQFFHPAFMWILLGTSVYTLYLGIQFRRARTGNAEEEVKNKKGKLREKHYSISSILLAFVIIGNLGGMAVTYINNGKLFVGPHLLVGLSILALIATSAALVPWMTKGNNLARNAHIVLNVAVLGLFSWQAFTGMQILFKIIGSLTGGESA
ncbi:MAG: DUF4079 domain-containing protein [Cyanobacteria bacterium SW_9_44_58]|nr:MAG: DUF4079 domain-containing protein [Cyanobacteria bacterium SW_9_44_58]